MRNSDIVKENQVRPSKIPFIISLSLLAVLVGSYFIFPGVKSGINEAFEILTSEDEGRIKDWVSQFGLLGPLVIILAMVVQMFLFIIPNILLMIISILSYGPIWGSVLALVGVFASSSTGFYLGRYLGPVTLNKLISLPTQQKIRDFIEQYGVAAIGITRLSSLSNDSLSIVAGLLKMSYRKYILATLAGITPLIVLLAIYGKNGKIEKALIWISAISLILFVLYVILDKRRKKKRLQSKNI